MISASKLISLLQTDCTYKCGFNTALKTARKKSKNVIYYVKDTPELLLNQLTQGRKVVIDANASQFSKQMGYKYTIHFIVVSDS